MGLMEELADKAEKAKASKGGNYLTTGSYLLEIQRCILDEGCYGGAMFIVETKILEATQTDQTKVPNKVGTEASFVRNMKPGETQQSALGDMKAFFIAALDEPEENITGAGMKVCMGPDQPLQFVKIRVDVFERPQKKDKTKTFTHHKWKTAMTPEEYPALWERQKAAKAAPTPTPAA